MSLRVEVLEARADGTAKFRLWYYKWRETRPDKPYVDVEIRSYPYRGGVRFVGRVYANEVMGISKDHLAEIANLLKRRGVEGVSLWSKGEALEFTGAFRDSVLRELGVKPELPPGEPPAVEHLGGLKFKIGDREVEFGRERVKGGYEFYTELKFPSREEAERLAASLKAIGVDARIVGSEKDGYTVKLDSDSFFGLLAATNAAPPGLTPLYRSKEDDFRVYASVEEGGRTRFYFAVRHGGVWRAAEGLYNENLKGIILFRAERDVLEAIRGAVEKALEKLAREQQGRLADVGEPKEERDKEGKVKVYYLYLYGPHLKPFLEHAAETVKAKLAEVRLEGRHIVISAGGVETAVELKLLKGKEAEFFPVQDLGQTLALYKSLKEVGVPVEITPKGVKVDSEAMWALVAIAVERSALSGLPVEVMPGVELLKLHSAGGTRMYIFRAEGVHYYFVVKAGEEWKAAGGKYRKRQVQIAGEAVPTIAEAINAIYREMGVDRRVEVKYDKYRDRHYIILTNVDLELLDLKRRVW